MRLRRVGQDIAGPADWSAYHGRSGRGAVVTSSVRSSRPTVPFFQLLFNYANCPAGPDPSRLASRPGAGSIVKSTRTLRGILTNRPAPYVIEIAIPLGLNCKLLYRSLQMLHDFTSRLLLHPSSPWNLEDPSWMSSSRRVQFEIDDTPGRTYAPVHTRILRFTFVSRSRVRAQKILQNYAVQHNVPLRSGGESRVHRDT